MAENGDGKIRVTRDRPRPLNAVVSAEMKNMRRAGTAPELALRRELHGRGLRYRVNLATLPGRPDLAFTRVRLAVFVDGCFWHRCAAHGVLPKHNGDWWLAKLDRNVARDREKDVALAAMGWRPMHVWEHENIRTAADEVERECRRLMSVRDTVPRMLPAPDRV